MRFRSDSRECARLLRVVAFCASLLLMISNPGASPIHVIGRTAAIGVALFFRPFKPKWIGVVAIFAATAVSAVLWSPSDFLKEDVYGTPFADVPAVEVPVLLGGDCIAVMPASGPGGTMTVCFYHDDYAVAAAHAVSLDDGPWPMSTRLFPPEMVVPGVVPEFIRSTSCGVVLSGLRPPTEDREYMKIGGTDDTRIGEEGVLHSSWKGSVRVRILGYTKRGNEQFLVFQCCEDGQTIQGGMSGSPIVQNGVIVGFASGTLWVSSLNPPQIGFARLAADVFRALDLSSE